MAEAVEAVVIGAGAAGLSAAFRLQKLGVSVINLEADADPGGVIRSNSRDGFELDFGPNTLVLNPYLEGIVEELELGSDVMEAEALQKDRYLVKDKVLYPLSPHPLKVLRTPYLSFRAKVSLLMERFRKARPAEGETVAAFFRRRFGKEVAESLADPIMSGIYAGDINKLSMAHTLPRLADWEGEWGSVTRGLMKHRDSLRGGRKVISFRGGMQQLADAFAGELGAALVTEALITDIRVREGGYTIVYTENNQARELDTECLIYAAPPYALAQYPFFGDLHGPTSRIAYAPLRVVHVGIRKDKVSLPPGFGFLVPSKEKLALLGCIFTSSLFPFKSTLGAALFTLMIGGAHREKELLEDPKGLQEQALRELREILRLGIDPVVLHGFTWRRAIPQKNVGYGAILEAFRDFERDHPGIYFAGNWISGVSVTDTMEYASKVAVTVSEAVAQRKARARQRS